MLRRVIHGESRDPGQLRRPETPIATFAGMALWVDWSGADRTHR